MDREQLQGVIGHEMSHIGNYDIRFTLLVGVLIGHCPAGGLVPALLVLGRRPAQATMTGAAAGGRRRSCSYWRWCWPSWPRSSAASSSSRSVARREALADVSAVELTRNPLGLARALRTISEDKEVLEVANRATQHLYIVNPIKILRGPLEVGCGTPIRRSPNGWLTCVVSRASSAGPKPDRLP